VVGPSTGIAIKSYWIKLAKSKAAKADLLMGAELA